MVRILFALMLWLVSFLWASYGVFILTVNVFHPYDPAKDRTGSWRLGDPRFGTLSIIAGMGCQMVVIVALAGR